MTRLPRLRVWHVLLLATAVSMVLWLGAIVAARALMCELHQVTR